MNFFVGEKLGEGAEEDVGQWHLSVYSGKQDRLRKGTPRFCGRCGSVCNQFFSCFQKLIILFYGGVVGNNNTVILQFIPIISIFCNG